MSGVEVVFQIEVYAKFIDFDCDTELLSEMEDICRKMGNTRDKLELSNLDMEHKRIINAITTDIDKQRKLSMYSGCIITIASQMKLFQADMYISRSTPSSDIPTYTSRSLRTSFTTLY